MFKVSFDLEPHGNITAQFFYNNCVISFDYECTSKVSFMLLGIFCPIYLEFFSVCHRHINAR